MVTDTEKMEAILDDALYPHHRQEDLQHSGAAAGSRAGRQERQEAAHHRRGRRGRGAVHPDRQPSARHLHLRMLSRLRASATAARICSSDIAILTGGTVISERARYRAEGRYHGYAGLALVRSRSPRKTPRSLTAQATSRLLQTVLPRSAVQSSAPPLTLTVRSCRSVWLSWQAALQLSRSALRPRLR